MKREKKWREKKNANQNESDRKIRVTEKIYSPRVRCVVAHFAFKSIYHIFLFFYFLACIPHIFFYMGFHSFHFLCSGMSARAHTRTQTNTLRFFFNPLSVAQDLAAISIAICCMPS